MSARQIRGRGKPGCRRAAGAKTSSALSALLGIQLKPANLALHGATPYGFASDRCGGNWSEMPEIATAADHPWHPVNACSSINAMADEIERIAKDVSASDGGGAAERLSAVASRLRGESENVFQAVADAARVGLCRTVNPEARSQGRLLTPGEEPRPWAAKPKSTGADRKKKCEEEGEEQEGEEDGSDSKRRKRKRKRQPSKKSEGRSAESAPPRCPDSVTSVLSEELPFRPQHGVRKDE